jgi:tetratricopeptide (TPR) repeat protein
MIKTLVCVAATALAAGAAGAADKLVMAPPAAWVQPVALPAPSKSDGAAAHVILQDQQVDLEPGRQTRYAETVVRIQTPQGLSGANVTFAWNPDTSTATVHKLQIRRGDKLIDLLATQSFTVVRRETNLENATIDGVLTATLQPEGVQVGDVIDFAVSVADSDPALKSHVEQIGGGWNAAPVDRVHMRVQWPATVPLRMREAVGLPPFKTVRKGGLASVELTMDAVQPLPLPKGAPLRYTLVRQFEMSDFANWSDLADLMAPLYVKAATLPAAGALKAEIATIAQASSDPKTRAEAALALVQDRVRYVFLGLNDGGLVPADAETTWSRRFGDCKGKTVLLLALLKALGIEAEPVIVNAGGGDGIDQRLPMVALFNHVLVRATIAGKTYWLDGTRQGDTRLDAIRMPDFRWGLPLVPGARLVAMDQPPLDQPMSTTAIRIDATAGITLPAPMHVETIWHDDMAVAFNLQLANLTPDMRDRALKDYWRGQYDFLDPKTVTISFDPARREEHLIVDGDAKMDWSNGWYETDGTAIGYKADFSRDAGPNQDAPFAVAYPVYTRTTETILLPPGRFTDYHAEPLDTTVAGVTYHRTAQTVGNTFTVEESARSVAREFPASDAVAAQATLRDLSDKTVSLRKPDSYIMTDKELVVAMAATPTTADGFVERGNTLLGRGRWDESIADFTKALALDPKNVNALADRGIAYVEKNEAALARADLDAAAAINPRDVAIAHGRGLLAERADLPKDAIAAYSIALDLQPDDSFAQSRRAKAYREAGDYDRSIADVDAVLRRLPGVVEMYLLKANDLYGQGKAAEGVQTAAALTNADPQNAYAHVVAARIYAKFGRKAEAMEEFDKALKIEPQAYVYVNRSNIRDRTDYVARLADLDAALKLDPKSSDALKERAVVFADQRNFAGAIAMWTAVLADHPDDRTALIERGIAYGSSGQDALAEKDFAAARSHATGAETLNNMCWEKATHGVALSSALADCDAALAKAPSDGQILDSRAFVLLRLGRLDEALSAYDAAIEHMPTRAASLYGRAVVEARKGDKAKSAADAAAALKAEPDVKADFDRYGVTIDAPAVASAAPKTS